MPIKCPKLQRLTLFASITNSSKNEHSFEPQPKTEVNNDTWIKKEMGEEVDDTFKSARNTDDEEVNGAVGKFHRLPQVQFPNHHTPNSLLSRSSEFLTVPNLISLFPTVWKCRFFIAVCT